MLVFLTIYCFVRKPDVLNEIATLLENRMSVPIHLWFDVDDTLHDESRYLRINKTRFQRNIMHLKKIG